MIAPFPWFGGKSRVQSLVWQRLGDVPHYVEPFAGSLAVLLGRPTAPQIETVNDLDGLICNFWRAVKADAAAVAQWADWPVSEPDLHARHLWLLGQLPTLADRLCADSAWFDAQIAGWWVWGICSWIGSGWCSCDGPWQALDGVLVKGNAGQGITRQLPHLGTAGLGIFDELSVRLRNVRVCQGDWQRVCGPSVTHKRGLTGVFLDPPYADTASRTADLYRTDSDSVAHEVRRWAIENGDNPLMRIALCGYESEHVMPSTWECVAWKAQGGYGGQTLSGENHNANRERIWFSPHCLAGRQGALL